MLEQQLRLGLKLSFTSPAETPWTLTEVTAHVSDEAHTLFNLASWLRAWNPPQDFDPPGSLALEHASIFTSGATIANWAGAQADPLRRRSLHKLISDVRRTAATAEKARGAWPFDLPDMPYQYARAGERQAAIKQMSKLLWEAKCDMLTGAELQALSGASASAKIAAAIGRAAKQATQTASAAAGVQSITNFMSPNPGETAQAVSSGILSGLLRSVSGLLASGAPGASATQAMSTAAPEPGGDNPKSPTPESARSPAQQPQQSTEQGAAMEAVPHAQETIPAQPLSQSSVALRDADVAAAEANVQARDAELKASSEQRVVMQALFDAGKNSEADLSQARTEAAAEIAKKRAADAATAAASAKRLKIEASSAGLAAQIAKQQAALAAKTQATEAEALSKAEAKHALLTAQLAALTSTIAQAAIPPPKRLKSAASAVPAAPLPAHVSVPKQATPPKLATGGRSAAIAGKAKTVAFAPKPGAPTSKPAVTGKSVGWPPGFPMPSALPPPTGAAAFYAPQETMAPLPAPTSAAVWQATPSFSQGALMGFTPNQAGIGAMSSRLASQPAEIQTEAWLWQQIVSGVNVPPTLGPAAPLTTSTLDIEPLQALGTLFGGQPACLLQALATLRATLMGMDVPMMGEVDSGNVEALSSSLNYRFNSSAIAPTTVTNIINLFVSTNTNFVKTDVQHASQLGARIAATLVEALRLLSAPASRRLAASTPGGAAQYSTTSPAATDDYDYDSVDSASVPKHMKMQDELAIRLHHRVTAPDVAPMLAMFNDCATGSDAQLQTAIQAVQGGLVPNDLRAAVFKTVKAASGSNMFNSLAPVRAFTNGRFRRAKAVITAHKLPPNDKLVLELSLGYFGYAGILALFRVTHGVRSRKVTSPSELSMSDILEAIDMHRMLVADMGWNGWQPAHQHEDLVREIRAILSTIADQGCDNLADNVRAATLGIWTEWAALTKRQGTIEAVRGRPFPSLTVAAHLLGDESFPRFGSKVEETIIIFRQHAMGLRHGFTGNMGSSPSPSPTKLKKKKTPTVHFNSDSDSEASPKAGKLKAKQEKKDKKKKKKAAAAPVDGTAAAQKILGRSPNGYPLSLTLFRKWGIEKHEKSCARQFKDMTKTGCGLRGCRLDHADVGDLKQLRTERIAACKADIDGGWGGLQDAANKRRAKMTPDSDDDG